MRVFSISVLILAICGNVLLASDWTRFRGPGGSGKSPDQKPTPVTWSESENLKWSIDLPGPGLSSPIIHGDKVFVTSWTGYEAGEGSSGDIADLKRALVCIDRNSGDIKWTKSVDAVQPEERYRGMFAENGYASHTPVTDGERIYAFFGKTGVVAFDMSGNQLWKKSVGAGNGMMGWGTSSSPILYKDLVIVPAAAESKAIIAFDKITGEQRWKQDADALAGTWSTPILVEAEGRTDLVIAVPYEVWGMNPETGKLRWYCEGNDSNSACASPIFHDGIIYFVDGRNGGSIAIRAGGKGDISESHVVWRGRHRSRIGTPVAEGDNLYFVGNGLANAIRLEDSEQVYRERLPRGESAGGRGRGRGGDYSSPVAADGKLYYINRSGTAYVMKLGDDFEVLATNKFTSDPGEYSATPAIVDGQLFIRSTSKLYCVEAE